MGVYQLGTEVEVSEVFSVDGTPQDPTTVTFRLRKPTGPLVTYVSGADPEVTHPAVGRYVLTFVPDVAGDWLYEAVGTGAVVAASPTGTFTVRDSDVVPSSPPPVIFGPCSPWVDAQDVAECCGSFSLGSDTYGPAERAAVIATEILWPLSGRQFSGECQQTVRPCASGCGCWGGQILPSPSGEWHWLPISGRWGLGPDCVTLCGCARESRVLLSGYPIVSVGEVKIDGDVVPDDEYEIIGNRWLTRLADSDGNPQAWPGCQRLDLPDTEAATFSVTYSYGMAPPETGTAAAAQLACEIFKACDDSLGEECQLPANVTQVIRQGVTYDFSTWGFDTQTRSWRTGLSLVDAFLNSVNPTGARRRSAVWTPSMPRYARPAGT